MCQKSDERVQKLARLGRERGLLDAFRICLVGGEGGCFSSGHISAAALGADGCLYLNRLKHDFPSLPGGFYLFVPDVLAFVTRDGETSRFGSHVRRGFEGDTRVIGHVLVFSAFSGFAVPERSGFISDASLLRDQGRLLPCDTRGCGGSGRLRTRFR
jgi:hypothetical protein